MTKNSTQGVIGAIIITTLVAGVVNWVVDHVFKSPEAAAASISTLSERVVRVETNDKNQDSNIIDLKDDVKHMRDILDQWAQRQGISIKQ